MPSSHSLCRLCAKPYEVSSLLHIFHHQKSITASLDALIKRYLPFPVTVNDNLSHYVCKLCCAHVVRWHRFMIQCIKAQDQLKSIQEKVFVRPVCGKSSTTEGTTVDVLLSQSQTTPTQVDLEAPRVAEQLKSYSTAKKKKSSYCIARWCNNSNDIGISFFRVPKDRKRALQWLSAADRMDLADKDVAYLYRCYVCATHFAKEMFVNENCKSLNRNAVPSIFPKPRYAQKIEEAQNDSETYPKQLQGVRLKNILPKSIQKLEEISTGGYSSSPQPSRNYAQLIRLLHEPQQKLENPMQEVLFIRDTVPCHSNIEIVSLFPLAEDTQELMQIMEVENTEGVVVDRSQVLTTVTNEGVVGSTSSTSTNEGFESPEKEVQGREGNTFICDNFQTESNYQNSGEISKNNESDCTVTLSNAANEDLSYRLGVNALPNNDIGFRSDGSYNDNDPVMLLDLTEKDTFTKGDVLVDLQIKNTGEDQNLTSESLGLHVLPSGDSLSSNIPVGSSYSSGNTSSLLQENLDFCSKESLNKHNISDCHGNIVGSQDFLLMHSSSNHIEPACDHTFRQDKNLNNLCCPTVREAASERPSVYGERSMMAEASVRTIECTSPNHGQIIEGLIDLDQFLDSA